MRSAACVCVRGLASKGRVCREGCRYSWRPADQPEYFPGRSAEVVYGDAVVGQFGIVHPEALEAFGVAFPVSALELNLEPFCVDQNGRSLLQHLTSDVPAA